MQFLNRSEEQAIIKAELAKPDSRFLVLYGRRRIGKSALLQNLLHKESIFYQADINEAQVQRSFFAAQIASVIKGFNSVSYSDWNTLFMQANSQFKRRVTIVIDEFPYLVQSSPELPSIIQKIIDQKHNSMFHLILCGSSQQMMQGMVLDRSAPLFGRAHRIMQLLPMDIHWLQQALKIDPIQAVQEYSIWGGVARNWELRKEYSSLEEAVKTLILDPYGILHEEPLRLFMDDLKNAVQPISIASLIGMGANKLSEIAARLNKPATGLNRPLQNMIETGYIKRDTCWGEMGKNSKKTIYRLLDPLSRFYFTFVVPNQSILQRGLKDKVWDDVWAKWPLYVSETWEELCRQSASKLSIEGNGFLPAQRWWQQSKKSGSAEIDIIAESLDGSCLLIGEAKWQCKAKPTSILKELNRKLEILEVKKEYRHIYKLLVLPEISNKTEGDVLYRNADFICSH